MLGETSNSKTRCRSSFLSSASARCTLGSTSISVTNPQVTADKLATRHSGASRAHSRGLPPGPKANCATWDMRRVCSASAAAVNSRDNNRGQLGYHGVYLKPNRPATDRPTTDRPATQ